MEVSANILEELKCDICQDYLSYSPVFSKNNGFTLCGRCFALEQQNTANRNLKYEAVARLIKFPCKYKVHGCKKTVQFAENYQEGVHEQICEFKKHECPVVEACDWLGHRKNILEHCLSAHPDHVGMNPCHLMLDITQSCVKTYILHCFEVLFLLYTKVCIATGKIYHAIKLLDASDKVSHFKYVLDIRRDDLSFSRPGKVTIGPEENSPIVTTINMLSEFLNGFSGTIFTVKLQNVAELKSDVRSSTSSSAADEERSCRNKKRGCNFRDTEIKCQKHEEFFCHFRIWCWICWSPVELASREVWAAHYLTAHACLTQQDDTYFEVKSTGVTGRTVIVNTRIGYVNCRYYLNNSSFKIYIWSICSSKKLDDYYVLLELRNNSAYEVIQLKTLFSETWDWYGKLDKDDFNKWDIKNFEMSLEIFKF